MAFHLYALCADQPINNWLIELFGRMPKVEDTIKHEDIVFIARKVRRSSIYEVILEVENN